MTNNINAIISAASAHRAAIRAIETAGHDCAHIDKDTFKVLYVNHSGYGKTIGQDFVNHPNEGAYTTALKFKAVLNLVQLGDLWLEVPAARAAQLGLDCPGSWVFSEDDISLEEALELVKASKEEANQITRLWVKLGIDSLGYLVDPEEDEDVFPMPPTKMVIAWLTETPYENMELSDLVKAINNSYYRFKEKEAYEALSRWAAAHPDYCAPEGIYTGRKIEITDVIPGEKCHNGGEYGFFTAYYPSIVPGVYHVVTSTTCEISSCDTGHEGVQQITLKEYEDMMAAVPEDPYHMMDNTDC